MRDSLPFFADPQCPTSRFKRLCSQTNHNVDCGSVKAGEVSFLSHGRSAHLSPLTKPQSSFAVEARHSKLARRSVPLALAWPLSGDFLAYDFCATFWQLPQMPSDERTPLLYDQPAGNFGDFGPNGSRDSDYHKQFCQLVGIPPSDQPDDGHHEIHPKSLYGRAIELKRAQNQVYQITASVSNSLLLAQVVIGAAVTALGASASSHVLITLFGAMNTIIAGIVAYLKSRGQPMRARMYRDDLERVVDEIENSEVMWLGISKHMHGYSDINDKEVTVRSEVARLSRLYDRAVKNNTFNNPDMYMATSGFDPMNLSLHPHSGQSQQSHPAASQNIPEVSSAGPSAGAVPAATAPDPDASPATAADAKTDKKPVAGSSKDDKKPADAATSGSKSDAKNSTTHDLDDTQEPATAAKP
jgi:hypothetical protein